MSVTATTREVTSLSAALHLSGNFRERFIEDASERLPLNVLLEGSTLYGRGEELQGRSVLLATHAQLTTAAALVELDGIARRVVLCPPELPIEHLPFVMETADVDSIVSDRAMSRFGKLRPLYFSPCNRKVVPRKSRAAAEVATEWILLTSGTTGQPKLVVHTLASLCAAITPHGASSSDTIWSTFYDVRRYGGLQIFLRAMLTGESLVLSSPDEPTSDFLARAGASGVTHISGTPSHWRRALMSPAIGKLSPQYIRLSGEMVDQAILNRLSLTYPKARIVHAFASTEAGVAFEVHDGLAGFPRQVLEEDSGAQIKVEDDTLRIRSAGAADRYLGDDMPRIRDDAGFVDTRDLVEGRDDRFYFAGRRDGVINVGGLKVYPEEVEAVISRHPEVHMCLVRARKSAITGAVVVADVVLRPSSTFGGHDVKGAKDDILQLCREALPSYKVPAAINVVPMLMISGSGKVMRQNA
jgi:acyl-CoA synthetase (AMP-forming)/AMP-acid ligase II